MQTKIGILKLIEINKEPKLGDLCWNSFYNFFIWTQHHIDGNWRNKSQEYKRDYMKIYEPIIICDDKIKENDKILLSDDIIVNVDKEWWFQLKVGNYSHIKKVLVQPNQFSSEFIQAIVDGKVKDGDKVEIEMEELARESQDSGGYLYKIKDGIVQGFSNTTLPIEELKKKGWTTEIHIKICKDNTAIIHSYKESVEDAAGKHAHNCILKLGNKEDFVKYYTAFIAGAKWAKENKY